ncbi:MAG: UDP-N-acetylglucosamine--N-acetylmuramyl-(pentapeptide) pyrophosphoryl-undecaprenol N-acetylglucosamine transferase [Parcubacteria group bacterium]|nr:UDP-N-acetylglucosamine--N-acetylmuramyl-(pentapeptide) pyrophosphoryl-undecaprenol N-acetylglucosamine transferase [Parcubacteria group bacterium]
MKKMRILLCGGGTGGHVLPLVAVARAVKKIAPETEIYFAGPEEFPLDSLREEGVIVKKIISAGKLRRYFSWLHIWELVKLPLAFLQSFFVVSVINPDVVLGKGSYGSILPVMCAELLFKKIIIHESDAVPGLANRFLSYITDNIAMAFEETKKFFPDKNVYVVGNPVRLKYLEMKPNEAEEILGVKTQKPIIFISGGSQGAQKINKVVLEALNELTQKYFVIWSAGGANYTIVQHSVLNNENVKIVPFLNEKELAAAYILCDVALGRAGAGTIFELAAFGKPGILIPLERNGGDQPINAQVYAQTGAAVVLKESELSKTALLEKISQALNQKDELSRNARKFAKIEAAEQLAQILLDLAN